MNFYILTSIIITLAALIGYINHRTLKLQSTIAIMLGSLFISLILLVTQHIWHTQLAEQTKNLLIQTDFRHLLLNGMLSFLLFAGALTIDINSLKQQKWVIGILSSVSTIASTLLLGTLVYYLLPLANIHLPYLYCLLFGALISPTDPIAVLATFKRLNAPKDLEICVAGESLFNDGVAIVIFLTLYQLAFKGVPITFIKVSELFLQQAIGGIIYGVLLGIVAHRLMKRINDERILVLITLAVVTGGYNLALALQISGPLAMVVAGIFIGNKRKRIAPNPQGRDTVDVFWQVVDEMLNAILFLLIGFELLTISVTGWQLVAVIAVIPLALLVRLFTVAIPMKLIQLKHHNSPYAISILTWGGLRGGLAVALALSLPHSYYKDFIMAMTYGIVAFAIIVQGITIKPLVKLAKASPKQKNIG